MRFSKISVTKKGVILARQTKDANGAVEETTLESPERPVASFVDALQAFRPYVVELLPLQITEDRLTITTLNLSDDKNGARGLIVTATIPVPKAYDKPLVLNTPLVREGGENTSDDAFVLTDEVLDLIQLAEQEAERYVNGERVQLELLPKKETSANAQEFDQRAAAAEVASTRKPRGRKPKTFVPGVGEVVNPNATVPPTDEQLHELLARVGKDIPVDTISRWPSTDRDAAQRWAEQAAKGVATSMPLHVQRSAEASLLQ